MDDYRADAGCSQVADTAECPIGGEMRAGPLARVR
jgi:hypothetical protein